METPEDRAKSVSPVGSVRHPRQHDVGANGSGDGSGSDDGPPERVTDDSPGPEDPHRPKLAEANPAPRSTRFWERAGAYVAVGAFAAGAAVVATLTATHRTAQRENLVAYLNGRRDAENTDYMAVICDLLDRVDELEEGW
jgi:hypothetical protein